MLPQDIALKWLGKDWIADAMALKERDPNAYLHEYMGVPVGYGTNVFPNIDIRDMDDEEISGFDNVAGGIDWGFANDPVAYTRSHYDVKRRILYIFDEIVATEMMNRQLAFKIMQKAPITELIVCDSAEPKSVSEVKEAGLKNAVKAKKGPGSVESGTKFLQELTLIVIDKKRCPNAAREFINAEFEVDRFGTIKNRIADHDNHTIDSIRYRMEKEMKRKSGWGSR
jgi:phage terminase large subunit